MTFAIIPLIYSILQEKGNYIKAFYPFTKVRL